MQTASKTGNSDDAIATLVQDHIGRTFPGAVIDIRRWGRQLRLDSFGNQQVYPHAIPMSVNTVFDLASLTKPLSTALLVLAVFHREDISLDRSLGDFVSGLSAAGAKRSIRSLLAHTAGFPATLELVGHFGHPQHVQISEAKRIVRSTDPSVGEGKDVLYSCAGYMLLGEMLQSITGISLDKLFERHLAKPLGLEHIGYRPLQNSHDPSQVAATEFCPWRGYWVRGEVHDESAWCLGGVAGNAGLFGTSSEIHILLNGFMDHGEFRDVDGKRHAIISPELARAAVSRQSPSGSRPRGLGFEIRSEDNTAGPLLSDRAFGHTGFTGTSCWVDPANGLSVVALTNRLQYGRRHTTAGLHAFRRSLNTLAAREYCRFDTAAR